MNCQSVEEIVNELARDRGRDQLDADVRTKALGHLDACVECGLKLRDQRALTRGLDELRTEMKSLAAPVKIEEQLLATFRQSRQRAEDRGQRVEITTRWNRWIVAAAAAVLIALGIGLLRYVTRQPELRSPDSPQSVAQGSPSVLPVPGGVNDNELEKQPEAAAPRKITRRHSRVPKRDNSNATQAVASAPLVNDTESEIATHFMPLGYAPINPQDGGQLVRVELSRTAMLSMGLPVNMDRYGERVKADVLLGPDGLARAIRFVQ